MLPTQSVAHFEAIITSEINTVEDTATVRLIYSLLQYAKDKEKQADNRELRPRPEGNENIAYYRTAIDFSNISSITLQEALTGLMDYTTELENLLLNAS